MSSDLGRKVVDTNVYDLSTVRKRIAAKDLPEYDVMLESLRIRRFMSPASFGYIAGAPYKNVLRAFEKNSKALNTIANDIVVKTVSGTNGMSTLLQISETLGISVGALVIRYDKVGGNIDELTQPWYDSYAFAGELYTDFEFKNKFGYRISEVTNMEGYTVAERVKVLHKAKTKSNAITPYTKLFT